MLNLLRALLLSFTFQILTPFSTFGTVPIEYQAHYNLDTPGNGTADAIGNVPVGARENGPNSDKKIAIVRKKRQPVILRNAFVNSIWRTLDPKTGQIRTNAVADPAGLELGENVVFAMEPSHCYEKCPCKWGNCIKIAEGPTILKEANECCAANHQFKCCEIPDLFPDNMKAITESLQSKCIETGPFFPDNCDDGCRKFGVAVYANGTKNVKEDLYDYFGMPQQKRGGQSTA